MDSHLTSLIEAVVEGEIPSAKVRAQKAIDSGLPAETVLKQGLIPAMNEVGQRYECASIFVPEMLVSAKAMQTALGVLKPLLAAAAVQMLGKVVIASVQGDLHDIGKNLVAMMLEGAGFEVVDLGVDVPVEQCVAAVKEHRPDILALSALLSTTVTQQQAVIQALQEAGLRDQIKVIVGGAPVTESFAKQIGADGYAPDAGSAAKLAERLVA